MNAAFAIRPEMEVLGSDGRHVGDVDYLRGAEIVLNRRDSEAGGLHHLIPLSWVDRVESQELKVWLDRTQAEAEAGWRTES